MTRTLKAMPAEHQRLWLSVCHHARQPIIDLVRRGVEPSRILVIAAPALSPQAWAMVECIPTHVVYWGDGPDDALVAVLGVSGDGDQRAGDDDDPLLSYLAGVPDGQVGLMIFDRDERPVISGCVVPPEAAPRNPRRGLNNGGVGS